MIGIVRRRRARPVRKVCETVARIDAGIVTTTSAHEASRSTHTHTTAAPVATRDAVVLVAAFAVAASSVCFSYIAVSLYAGLSRRSHPGDWRKKQSLLPSSEQPTNRSQQQTAAKTSSHNQPSNQHPPSSHQPPAATSHPPANSSQAPASSQQKPGADSSQQQPPGTGERERESERTARKGPGSVSREQKERPRLQPRGFLEVFGCFVQGLHRTSLAFFKFLKGFSRFGEPTPVFPRPTHVYMGYTPVFPNIGTRISELHARISRHHARISELGDRIS